MVYNLDLLSALCVLALAIDVSAQGSRQYTVINNCPISVNLLIGGNLDSILAQGASTTKTLGINAGFFYSDANGGNANGAGTRAGFYGDNDSYYYYIVKDADHFNMGISIAPNKPAVGSFCPIARCDDVSCTGAFSQPPTRFPPATCNAPPAPPVYSCPYADLSYVITFCPSGTFPGQGTTGQAIHPNFTAGKCLDVRGANFANGTPVQVYDCNGTGAQNWVLNRGSTKVKLAGTNFCLDAGSTPGNGVGMKIWQCYVNLAAQQWSFTNDNRIALLNQGQCLDLPGGSLTNGVQVQSWQCTDFNTNQVWTV
ncbi:ricin B lectin domain-containing protein [Crassisporium funariophilum]|nr:ricin B lectin domain-containing protein [Crassisporium funariophilum]